MPAPRPLRSAAPLALFGALASCGGKSVDRAGDASGGSAGSASGGSAGSASGGSAGTLAAGAGGTASGGAGGGGRDSSCDSVVCLDLDGCAAGFVAERTPGACCAKCVPAGGEPVGCAEIACPESLDCPRGYVPGGGIAGGCCYECVPDSLFCVNHRDCVLASGPSVDGCCACPQVISGRLYDEDRCWFGGPDGRPEPDGCAKACDASAACPCQNPGEPYCEDNRCVSGFVPPPK